MEPVFFLSTSPIINEAICLDAEIGKILRLFQTTLSLYESWNKTIARNAID